MMSIEEKPDEARCAAPVQICPVCRTPGCIETRGADFHAGGDFGSRTCDYRGTPPFAAAAWKDDPTMCQWCAGTGHPHADEAYGMCECPDLRTAQAARQDRGRAN